MISTRTNSMDYSPHSDYGFFMGWYIAVSPNVCKTHTQNARENRARKNRKKNLGRHWLGYGRAGHWYFSIWLPCSAASIKTSRAVVWSPAPLVGLLLCSRSQPSHDAYTLAPTRAMARVSACRQLLGPNGCPRIQINVKLPLSRTPRARSG